MASPNVVLGEMTQSALGVGGQLRGASDAAPRIPSIPVGRERKFVRDTPYKRPCCKTCSGKACVGKCKF